MKPVQVWTVLLVLLGSQVTVVMGTTNKCVAKQPIVILTNTNNSKTFKIFFS